MSNIEQALKSAIEALKAIAIDDRFHDAQCNTEEVYTLKGNALMQCTSVLSEIGKCEAVAEVRWRNGEMFAKFKTDFVEAGTKLYTSPISKDWVTIHDDDINELSELAYKNGGWDIEFARAIEAKLKALNHE